MQMWDDLYSHHFSTDNRYCLSKDKSIKQVHNITNNKQINLKMMLPTQKCHIYKGEPAVELNM